VHSETLPSEHAVVILTGELHELAVSNALAHSLVALKGSGWIVQVKSTGKPSFVADVFLAVTNLNRRMDKRHQNAPLPVVIYPEINSDSAVGIACASDLLTFLLAESEAGYPCIIDVDTRCATCTECPSRISPLKAVTETIQIASQAEFSNEERSEVTVPPIEPSDVDGLRSLMHHWTRPIDGLNLANLLDRNFGDFRTRYEQWDDNWYDRHHWRSFYAVCQWLSFVPDPLPERNGIQPSNTEWQEWARIFDALNNGKVAVARDLFESNQEPLRDCLEWMQSTNHE